MTVWRPDAARRWKRVTVAAMAALVVAVAAVAVPPGGGDDTGRLDPAGLLTVARRSAPRKTTAPEVVVLHDSHGPWGHLGSVYATMTVNLLGHFGVRTRTAPVASYRSGDLGSVDAVVYVGSTYDEPGFMDPAERAGWDAFLRDVATTTTPVLWMGMNLWHLAWSTDPSLGPGGFPGRFGFRFDGLDEGGWNRVVYKGQTLDKGVVRLVFPGSDLTGCREDPAGWACAPTLGVTTVTDPAVATVRAEALVTGTGRRAPYVISGANLWYVGDIPFSYASEEDRYLAVADLLHDFLGIDHAEQHRALVRFEDVNSTTDPTALGGMFDALAGRGVPFGVALIPVYRDPLGHYNDGQPVEVPLGDAPALVDLITGTPRRLLSVVQHGTTHQLGDTANPFNGVSGDDYEFYVVDQRSDGSLVPVGPVPGDSPRWARNRVREGRDLLRGLGIRPFGFEAPHYLASATDYRAITRLYPVHWGRVSYFPVADDQPVGQFFPYPVVDTYGQRVVPESLGNIQPDETNGFAATMPADLIRRARAQLVVRDGVAAFFFHPFLDPALLTETVDGIRALGYEFVRAESVVR